MLNDTRYLALDIFDYAGHKQCSLYDGNNEVSGQAVDVVVTTERNGWKELTFTLPQMMQTEDGLVKNYRRDFIKEGYKVRLIDEDGEDWFILSESKITHNNYTKTLTITAGHVCQLLKHKRLELEFSDEEGNNVGTAETLLKTILEGTGWTAGKVTEFKEKDKSTKYRSLKASVKTGAFKLIANMCDLFEAKPVYHGDTKTVDIVPMNPFSVTTGELYPEVGEDQYIKDLAELNDKVVELHYGENVSNVSRTLNEENMITRLYAYGSYGDKTNGYCGIDECTHHVYKLVCGNEGADPGDECMINVTDSNGISYVRYFMAGRYGIDYPMVGHARVDEEYDLSHKISTVYWSDLDPASRMYVWNKEKRAAYLLYETPKKQTPDACFTVEEGSDIEEQNWFSSLMDFHYYNEIGLLTDDMLQTIATYQQEAPPYMATVAEKATVFADKSTELAETIGSVDFCRLNCTIDTTGGNVVLHLQTNVNPKGVMYRTDYDKKEDKQFKWRVAKKLKANGDPVSSYASVVYIVYEPTATQPLMYEKSYLKMIDDEPDPSEETINDPHKLTLWLPSEQSKFHNQGYRIYLFGQNNINGLLGAYESSDESTATAIDNATKLVTVRHPVFYQREEPSNSALTLNGYGWWWKWYDGEQASEMYFCWTANNDTAWKPVIFRDVDPVQEPGDYWFNWKKAVLYRKESGVWVAKNEAAIDKRIAALFGSVFAACMTRDKYYKGVYQHYIYTEDSELPAGNYAFSNGFGGYWVFTTKGTLQAGDTLNYDSTQATVTQTISGVDEILEAKSYRFDNVHYHPENVLTGMSEVEAGELDDASGGERESTTKYRSNFVAVYPATEYVVNGFVGNLDVYYYDENRTYLGYAKNIDGMDGSFVTRGGEHQATEVGDISINNTKYIRIVTTRTFDAEEMRIATPNVENKIIAKEDETYTVLLGLTHPEGDEVKGITPLTKKFADLADEVYQDCLPKLQAAQKAVDDMENNMKDSLGDMYREGFWQKNDYVDGDEKKLYDDALDNLTKLSQPEAKYDITYLDRYGANTNNPDYNASGLSHILWPDISTESAAHLIDPEIGINTWAFVDKVQKCYDQPWKTKISINTNLTTISQHSFTDVMTHIAEVASEAKGRMSLYERAAAITENGAMAAERLEGKIDANKLLITGGSSTWYTDDRGNMVFESADGMSAMTLTGNGFGVANSKTEDGEWNWRT